MAGEVMDRKEFVVTVGGLGLGACLCAAAGGLREALADEPPVPQPGDKTIERAAKRMEFADVWVRRFFDVLDGVVDEPTRRKLMIANGAACLCGWITETGQEIERVDFEEWARRVKASEREGIKIEGNVVTYQYTGSAETGQAAPEGVCLCPMVESQPAGMSPTYCLCSVGYVKEMYERRFGRKVEVRLVDSVLKGGKRCTFEITVS